MPLEYQLRESGSAVADANGTATVRIGPKRAFESWQVTTVAIQSTSSTLIPTLKEYRGDVQPSRLTGLSFTGIGDVGTSDIRLLPGETLVYQWTGADVGAECTVTVQGSKKTQ